MGKKKAESAGAINTKKPKERVILPPNYVPSEDEEYMNSYQEEFFRQLLLNWRNSLQEETRETIHHLQQETHNEPDSSDRATVESDRALELRIRDRGRKLITKIDEALQRLDDGSYGFCEETGEPIGINRLKVRPIATLSVEAQERHEKKEKTHRDQRV